MNYSFDLIILRQLRRMIPRSPKGAKAYPEPAENRLPARIAEVLKNNQMSLILGGFLQFAPPGSQYLSSADIKSPRVWSTIARCLATQGESVAMTLRPDSICGMTDAAK
ncbi:MAG: hypothetical protein KAX58_03570 [Aeromonadaceae bacterium]|nr:hypothetical protein [Aeromonadaceae bacterium]